VTVNSKCSFWLLLACSLKRVCTSRPALSCARIKAVQRYACKRDTNIFIKQCSLTTVVAGALSMWEQKAIERMPKERRERKGYFFLFFLLFVSLSEDTSGGEDRRLFSVFSRTCSFVAFVRF